MGYSTTLYAVDIGLLQATVGSGDSALLKRLEDFNGGASERESPELESKPDRVIQVTKDGGVLFDGQETTLGSLAESCRSLAGGNLEVHLAFGWTEGHSGVIKILNEDVVPQSRVERVIMRAESNDPKTSMRPTVFWPRPDDEEDDEEETSPPSFDVPQEAREDLIHGRLSNCGPEHGRALELLCYVLGDRLRDEDALGDLEPLGLDSPLTRPRCPAGIGEHGDFPIVSFLTAEEVAAEAKRLSKVDLSFPDDDDIEEARETYFRCLKEAAKRKKGVVSFYQ